MAGPIQFLFITVLMLWKLKQENMTAARYKDSLERSIQVSSQKISRMVLLVHQCNTTAQLGGYVNYDRVIITKTCLASFWDSS